MKKSFLFISTILSTLLILSVSCSKDEADEVASEKANEWSDEQKTLFVEKCVSNTSWAVGVDEEGACNCTAEKLAEKYNYDEVSGGNIPDDIKAEITTATTTCTADNIDLY